MMAIQRSTESQRLLDKSNEGVPARYVFAAMGFLAFFTVYTLRTCLNVAMVAMVNSTALMNEDNIDTSSVSKDLPAVKELNNGTRQHVQGKFAWDERTQGAILAAFYYGYTIQLFSGWMADKMSGKMLLGGSVLTSSLLSLTIPSAARAGTSCLITVRVLQGVIESVSYPAMHVLCAEWATVAENTRMTTIIYSGAQAGILCGMLSTGFLSRYGFAGGWPSAFYVFGMLGCVWFLLWLVLVYDSPAVHPRISDRERLYIQSSVGDRQKATLSVPWRDVLTSAPVWGTCIAHFSLGWGYFSMFTCLPTFMKQILHFRIVENGFLSALPYLLMWLEQVLAAIIADRLRQHTTTAFTRKLMYAIGCVVPAGFLVTSSYVIDDRALAVVLLTIAVSATGFAAATIVVTHLDFAPRFAGTLFGLSNSISSVAGFLAPSLVGVLTNQNQTIVQWRKFFYITAAVYAVGIVCFLWLGRGEQQSWAAPKPTSTSIPTPKFQIEKNAQDD